ncbi:hypothetical protein PM082_015659 [Marasmius tenuissimus]|nr:hypothetical protein PM082_015659 [Marasmius tenuissimus]
MRRGLLRSMQHALADQGIDMQIVCSVQIHAFTCSQKALALPEFHQARFPSSSLDPELTGAAEAWHDHEADVGGWPSEGEGTELTLDAWNGEPYCSRSYMPVGNDILVEHHPSIMAPNHVMPFQSYLKSQRQQAAIPPLKMKPWAQFLSRIDFDVANFALEARLNKNLTDVLLQLIKQITVGEKVLFKNHQSVCDAWESASHISTPFEKQDLPPSFKTGTEEVEWTGAGWERFVSLPWTADRFWEIQSALPASGKPLAYIVYSDKTRLLSFGSATGYPVIARIANIDNAVQNSNINIGGGRVIGWIDIIPDNSKYKKLKGFIELKRILWQKQMEMILSSVKENNSYGIHFEFKPKEELHLWPCIPMSSSDYEKQGFYTLMKGPNSKAPCPVCLVPKEQLSDHSKEYPARMTESMRALIQTEDADAMKEAGIRNVEHAHTTDFTLQLACSITSFWNSRPVSKAAAQVQWIRLINKWPRFLGGVAFPTSAT